LRWAFRKNPIDLVAIFVLTAILTPLALYRVSDPTRIILGLFFVILAPGYVFTSALFPKAADLDWIERIVLSVGLSIALTALLGIGLLLTPSGIRLEPVIGSLVLFIGGTGAVAWWRRVKLPSEERIGLTVTIKKPEWFSFSRADKIATVALAASLVFAAGTVVYVVVTPRSAEHFTEFYILNATGVAGGYPWNLTVNQTSTINLTVHNVEYAYVAYEIRVVYATMEAFFNASANRTQYRELSRTTITNFSLNLPNGDYWNRSYRFFIPMPGIYRLYFHLYKLPDTSDVYRYLFLTVRVRG
jgi:uncharacterized membrane protein